MKKLYCYFVTFTALITANTNTTINFIIITTATTPTTTSTTETTASEKELLFQLLLGATKAICMMSLFMRKIFSVHIIVHISECINKSFTLLPLLLLQLAAAIISNHYIFLPLLQD